MQRQCAPAATGLDHLVAGPQAQFAADVLHFRHLGIFQSHGRRREIGAGVDHLPIEPQLVEIVAEIVVVMDVVARLLQRVAPRFEHRAQPRAPAADAVVFWQGAINHFEQFGQIALHLDMPRCVEFTELEGRIGQQPEQGAVVMNQDSRLPRGGARRNCGPIPQHELQRRVADGFEHTRHQHPRHGRHRSVQAGPGLRACRAPAVSRLPVDGAVRAV